MSQEVQNPQNTSLGEAEKVAADLDFSEAVDDSYEGTIRTRMKWSCEVFDFFETLVIAACALLFLFAFVARVSGVSGDSMNTTLDNGDRVIVSDLFYTPAQGDIVVFQKLGVLNDSAIVKRVIAVGGQTVCLRYSDLGGINRVSVEVDGVTIDEPYRYYDTSLPSGYAYRYTGTHVYEVPEGHLFVMGDNTYNSEDSRGEFSFIKEEQVLGRVVFRIWCDDLSELGSKLGPVS